MTIVIVGLGKLGSDVAARLTARGQDVLGLRRTAATPTAPEPSSAPERVAGRLTHAAVDLIAETPTLPTDTSAIVVALAPRARSVEAYDALYRGGIGHLLDAASTLPTPPRIVFVSSTAVWGEDAGEELDDASPATPATGTGHALLAAEGAIRAAVPEASCVRFGGLYGPASTMLVDQVRAGAVTRSSGWTNRIHRDDAAAVVLHLLDLPAEALPAVVAGIDEEPALLSDVVDHLADRLGVAPPRLDDAGRTLEERRRGKRIAATALRGTGFTYRYPTFREGYAAQLTDQPAPDSRTSARRRDL
ncbi:sugar nucleotide-binding protein [Plantibacter flavus]|uniref:NAD-dependent epimerase/dehydratase family protein n=1 Tax=Plantibacter flavus TaxID=150123 RepID=UPI003F17ADA3